MERIISETDIGSLFDDKPARDAITQRIRDDDYSILFDLTLGYNDGVIQLPPGASAGYKFELYLKELIGLGASAAGLDFDDLPLPYRAIATDLETGEMKVFSHGELPRVMRASMSLPGILSPTEIDGRIFVDGGLTNNLPVEAGRELCGDVLIVVNLSTKPKTREEVRNSIDVAMQSVVLLISQNSGKSLKKIGNEDILIVPELDEFRSSSFSEQRAIINRGVEATISQIEQLSRLSVTEVEYDRWLVKRRNRIPQPYEISDIRVETRGAVDAKTILRDVETKPGDQFEIKALNQDIAEIYGRGDFSYVGYSVVPSDQENAAVVIRAITKSWGPGYLKFGFGTATDFSSPTQYNLGASYRRTWINRLGAEWRTDIQIGYDSFIKTQFIQPLQLRDGAFIAPYVYARRHYLQYYLGTSRLGDYVIKRFQGGLNLGISGKSGEIRINPYISRLETEPEFGIADPLINPVNEEPRGVEFSGILDQLDRPQFPRAGFRAAVNFNVTHQQKFAPDNYTRSQAELTKVISFQEHTLSLHLEWGDDISSEDTLPVYDFFQLGGPNRLSGLYLNQLSGSRYELATMRYYRQYAVLPPQLGTGMYFGASLETGKINDQFMDDPSKRINAGNIFWAADTILGDIFIGYGYTPSLEQDAWYLLIGPEY